MGLFENLTGTVSDSLKVGIGTAGDKKIIANNADANKPELRYDDTANKWQVGNDGVAFSELIPDTANAAEFREESFSTAGTETVGATVTKYLAASPGVSSSTTSGYAIEVYCNGLRLTYNASPSTTDHFKYTAASNKVEVLASGFADDYSVVYLSKGVYTPEEQLIPDWTDSGWLSKWSDVQSYITRKKDAGALPHAVTAYSSGQVLGNQSTRGMTLASDGKIYLIPYTNVTNWYYLDYKTGLATSYASISFSYGAYGGGALCPNGRIYMAPLAQCDKADLHYIDTNTVAAVPYTNTMGFSEGYGSAYHGPVLAPDGKVWLVPFDAADQSSWHYINSASATITAYAHGLGGDTPGKQAYIGGALCPNGRIYMAPYAQSNQTKWHYIDTNTNTVVAYAHGLGGDTPVANAYFGCVLAPDGKVWLIPYAQAGQSKWHYIDSTTGTVVAYAHNLGADIPTGTYCGGVLAPNSRIYLIPRSQSPASKWHYIDTLTGMVAAYAHGMGTLTSGAYISGALAPNGRIYMGPYDVADESTWHYIDTRANSPWSMNLCLNPIFNCY